MKHAQALDIVLDNFTKTVKSDRFARNTVRTILEGLLEELTPKGESLPKHITDFRAGATMGSFEVEDWVENIWLMRLSQFFTPENGWETWRGELTTTIHSVDQNKLVSTLAVGYTINYFSAARKLDVEIYRGPYDTSIRLYHYSDTPTVVDELSDLVEDPDPYEGKIIRLTESGKISILELSDEGIQDYSDDAEASIAWLSRLSDSDVRERLEKANLAPRAGLLLEGPPGSGKTTLARREAARHAGKATVIYPDADANVNMIFDLAERYPVVFMILEDVESFFGSRGASDFSDFLNAFDGVSTTSGLMVLATTNDSSGFDDAIRRPGRLERRAVIKSIHEGFTQSLLEERLNFMKESEITTVAAALEARTSKDDLSITPAMADSVARTIIMEGYDAKHAYDYIMNFWVPSYTGESYIS